jgi:hypothetical protein
MASKKKRRENFPYIVHHLFLLQASPEDGDGAFLRKVTELQPD